MQVQRGENHPPARRMDPEFPPKSVGDQHEEERGKQDGRLRPKQLELDQTAPAHRGGKEKRHLRFRKGQRRSLVRNQPGDGHHDEKHAGTDRFVKPRGAG